MKKRRVTSILALGLSAVLLVSQLGCGSGVGAEEPSEESKTTQAEASQETVEEAEAPIEKGDPFGKYEEPVKVTAMTSIATTASATDYENSLWSAKMRELFNIDIEYVFLAAKEQYDERVNLMLASGDLPDVMNVSLTQMHQMIEAGLLQPLTEVFDGYVTDQAKEAMTQDGTFPFDAATVDGELYGIPWVQPRIETCHALFVNEKWRKDNNLPEPDTWENFEKMIYAFA
ncbi:MAG: extracellular solute-binding protein, partial [Eisenbergiella sp.]